MFVRMQSNDWDKDEYVLLEYAIEKFSGKKIKITRKVIEKKLRRPLYISDTAVKHLNISFLDRLFRRAQEQRKPFLACVSLLTAVDADSVDDD